MFIYFHLTRTSSKATDLLYIKLVVAFGVRYWRRGQQSCNPWPSLVFLLMAPQSMRLGLQLSRCVKHNSAFDFELNHIASRNLTGKQSLPVTFIPKMLRNISPFNIRKGWGNLANWTRTNSTQFDHFWCPFGKILHREWEFCHLLG